MQGWSFDNSTVIRHFETLEYQFFFAKQFTSTSYYGTETQKDRSDLSQSDKVENKRGNILRPKTSWTRVHTQHLLLDVEDKFFINVSSNIRPVPTHRKLYPVWSRTVSLTCCGKTHLRNAQWNKTAPYFKNKKGRSTRRRGKIVQCKKRKDRSLQSASLD